MLVMCLVFSFVINLHGVGLAFTGVIRSLFKRLLPYSLQPVVGDGPGRNRPQDHPVVTALIPEPFKL